MTTEPADPERPAHPRGVPLLLTAALLLSVLGAATAVAGMFGPWLRSGEVLRNSFEVVGTLQRFDVISATLLRWVIGVWPLLGPAMLLPVVLAALRLWRTSAVASVVLGVSGVAASVAALVYAGGRGGFGVTLVTTGPFTVICGCTLLVVGAVLTLLAGGRDLRLCWHG